VSLNQKPEMLSMIAEAFSIQGMERGKSITLQIYQHAAQEKFLEIELQAAAFSVDGGRTQQQLLNWMNAENLSYRWNCHFQNSGKHTIALIFRVNCSSEKYELGVMHHTIKVVQLDHLTHRQVQIITSITYIAGF